MDVAGYSFAICQVMVCAAAGSAARTSPAATAPAKRRRARRRIRSISGGAAREKVHAGGGHDHLAVLVPHLHDGANDPAVRLAPRGSRLRHGQTGGERVAGPHGFEPAQLVDAGGPEARRVLEEALVEEAHERAPRMPAARDEPGPDAGLGGLRVGVKGLRIELAGEAQHALLVHGVAAQLDNLARLHVIPVAHERSPPRRCGGGRGGPATVSYTRPRARLIE